MFFLQLNALNNQIQSSALGSASTSEIVLRNVCSNSYEQICFIRVINKGTDKTVGDDRVTNSS